MKIQILITSLLIFNSIYANKPVSIKQTYEYENGKKDIFILQLLDNSRYNFTRYLGKTVCHDSGLYQIKGHAIEFRTTINSTWANYFLKNKYYIDSKGIYVSRLNALLNKNIQYRLSEPTNKLTDWMYNPITKTTITKTSYDFDKAKKTSVYRPLTAERLEKNKNVELSLKQAEIERADLRIKTAFAEKRFAEMINRFIPKYDHLIQTAYCGPGCYKEISDGAASFSRGDDKDNHWCGDSSEFYLIHNWNLIVHESTHKMNDYNYDTLDYLSENGLTEEKYLIKSKKYLIEPDKHINVSVTQYFHTSEIESIVPKNLLPKLHDKNIFSFSEIDSVQRYRDYINKGANTSSNSLGIFGMLDEFSAYYHGINASLDAAKSKYALSNNIRYNLLESIYRYYTSYYEFNLFIAWYLKYAKINKKDIYESMMLNKELRVAYTLIDSKFKKCLSDYSDAIKSENALISKYKKNEDEYITRLKRYLTAEQSYLDEFKLDSKANYAE
jgi:hypothetical protein